MKYRLVTKAVAIILAALALVTAIGSGTGMLIAAEQGLHTKTVQQLKEERMEEVTNAVADSIVREYIKVNYSAMTKAALEFSNFYTGYDYYWYELNGALGVDGWQYYLLSETGEMLSSKGSGIVPSLYTTYTHMIQLTYPKLLAVQEVPMEESGEASTVTTEETAPVSHALNAVADECLRQYDEGTGLYYDYYYDYVESPVFEVQIALPMNYTVDYTEGHWQMLQVLWDIQDALLPCLLAGLMVFLFAMAYLVAVAGHGQDSNQVKAGGLNRLPLDLYTAIAVGACGLLVAAGVVLMEFVSRQASAVGMGLPMLTVLCFVAAAVVVVAYLFAVAAQFKTAGGFWWRNSALGFLLRIVGRGFRWLLRMLNQWYAMMSVAWQWAVTAFVLGMAVLSTGLIMAVTDHPFFVVLFLVALLACGAAVLYGAYAFGVLLSGARRMAQGDLNRQIPTKYLFGCFADCANQLNALADVAVEAAKNQMKSDRMKTELITNVSHDIKTPLTSIINYVDLLQKPHTEQQGQEYLAVLARQSSQMKKLLEDLMDMSKATTGNMVVEIIEMDAVEAVNQALGEFSDKLEAASLAPVVRYPDGPVMIRADGRLVWRTLSNLLQNAVKYALPGTRLYVDVVRLEGNVVISMKNISREQLNITAEELMERFVRGDASRNTEGSGLGLNIAKSLMELQRGQLQLLVDGDLFKTSLSFPAAD